ncbi:hypothetical protein [Natronorubrum bangense]|uniref:hypothetical protein n=1 Tax=Natronorubrum bangense TaxID=61858 RepID=UPI0010A3C279|nr:hypothetical protein [Natronorubrum bangense]
MKISREAAALLVDRHEEEGLEYEPVIISVGGVDQGRYVYDPEEVRTVQGDQQAWVTLSDPLTRLNRTTITQVWDSVTVDDAIQKIVGMIDDPHNAITRVDYIDEGVEGADSFNNRAIINQLVNLSEDAMTTAERTQGSNSRLSRLRRFVENYNVWKIETAMDLMPYVDAPDYQGGFEFEDTPLLDALFQVCNEFGLVPWVKTDGTLWIGLPELADTRVIPIYGDPSIDKYVIQQYNVTRGHSHAHKVTARGSSWRYRSADRSTANLYPEAEAWVGDGDKVISFDEPIRVRSATALERYVRGVLINEYARYKNGNIVFNGIASTDSVHLVELGIGDSIFVSPQIEQHCDDNVDGGHFVVNEIQHDINTRVGWQITATVGGLPDGDIQSKAVMVDRRRDIVYDSIADFVEG